IYQPLYLSRHDRDARRTASSEDAVRPARHAARLEQRGLRNAAPALLVIQQPRLAIEAAAVAGEVSGRADDAMTRDDDRDWIRAVGGACGARGTGRSERLRDGAIAGRLAGGDARQRLPHPFLEWRAAHVERDIADLRALAGEISVQPPPRTGDDRRLAVGDRVRRGG